MTVRTRRRGEYIIDSLQAHSGTRVMELGCGTGELAHFIAEKTGASVLGIDVCEDFITEANKRHSLHNLRFKYLDFNNAALLQGETFDCIIGNGILHHLYSRLETALTSIFSLLNEGGRIIFLEPNIFNPYCYVIFKIPFFRQCARLDPDEMAFTKSFAVKKLKNVGFTDIAVAYKDFLLPVTPGPLIRPVVTLGSIMERIPLCNMLSQSIFISAGKPSGPDSNKPHGKI